MKDRAYVVMDRLPGNTLNELTYRRPEIIEDNRITIAYQLGMHMAFSFVFGSKDGYQTNYIFDPVSKILTRIDKESFFDMPADYNDVLSDGNLYTEEIAACELANLKYIPSYRKVESRHQIIFAFRQGFIDKYQDIKDKKANILRLVDGTRQAWLKIKPVEDIGEYGSETTHIRNSISFLVDLSPDNVFDRLLRAKAEVNGKYVKK